jgi:hypothetical protein
MITTPTVSGKPGQAPMGLSCDLYPLIGSHSTWTDPRGPVTSPGRRPARTRGREMFGATVYDYELDAPALSRGAL